MSERKHTPGPWSAPDGMGYAGGYPYVGVDSPDGMVAMVVAKSRRPITGAETDKPFEANAHLIAAAPEMLEALELVAALPIGTDFTPEHNAAVRAAERALAKAKGQTP